MEKEIHFQKKTNAGPRQWLSPCTWPWWGHILDPVSSSGSLIRRRTLRCWGKSREWQQTWCLRLKDPSALSVYVMITDEPQGRAEWPLHLSSLAEMQQSPSDPYLESAGILGCWQGSQGFPFQFCFLQKESAGDQIKKKPTKKATPYSQATCNRQVNNSLASFFFVFFLSASSSNSDTIVEWKRDEKIVWLYFFTNDLLKSVATASWTR